MTYSSASSSVDFMEGDTCMHLPSLEEVSKGDIVFKCIFYHELKSFGRERSWKRHAYQDLKAYSCTLRNGKCDLVLFGDREEWFQHVVQHYRRQWNYIICKGTPFRSESSFMIHAKALHAELDFLTRGPIPCL
ncbi:hypothetical protein F4775DRAFT_394411 [Biscogniauxia sp. FL1348]|nr:hypothetical protein F4775DRAFT_394411 [Biscogniauxia sp. FL1348]